MEYRIVIGKTIQNRIADLIADGWRPQGGVSIAFDSHGLLQLAQAVVREVAREQVTVAEMEIAGKWFTVAEVEEAK
ncbi:MAG: DUF1737 domain-containing protein [Gammaproteobacteria bacterium]|nr:DUF1737 domain-containing protein [Gammaproteobacteria bacterium]